MDCGKCARSSRGNDLGSSLPGFGARRQKSGHRVCAEIPNRKAASVGSPLASMARPGRPKRPRAGQTATGDVAHRAILPPKNGQRAMLRRFPSVRPLLCRCRSRTADDAPSDPEESKHAGYRSGPHCRHIKPLLGQLRVAAVTREDVECFMHDVAEGKTAAKTKTKPRGLARVRGGKGAANRTVGLLGAIFTYAVRHRMRRTTRCMASCVSQMAGESATHRCRIQGARQRA